MTREDFEHDGFDKCYTKEFDGVEFLIGECTYGVAVVREENLKNYCCWEDYFWLESVWDKPPRGFETSYYNNREDYLDEDDAVETWVDYHMSSSSDYNQMDCLDGSGDTVSEYRKGVRECLEYLAETYVRPCVHRAFTRYATDHKAKHLKKGESK